MPLTARWKCVDLEFWAQKGKGRKGVSCCLVFPISDSWFSFCFTVENKQLTLDLQTENKGSLVSGGEVTIFLDGPGVDMGSRPNGSVVAEGECHREGRLVSLTARGP